MVAAVDDDDGGMQRQWWLRWGSTGGRRWRMATRGGGDRVDRVMGRLLGLGRKTRRKSDGCDGGRNVGRRRWRRR
ncbi:hypothetical protein Tco_0833923, partial [Tanacetum coccineum]